MSLGNSKGNYNQNKEQYSPTVYSPISFKNPVAKVQPSEISFSFWKNLLCLVISPKLDKKPGDEYDKYDRENNIKIHLTCHKARLFRNDILKMLKDTSIQEVSVPSGQSGLLTFSNGKSYGVNNYMFIIRNLDAQSGEVVSSYSYEINGSNYYTIRNFNEQDSSFDREMYAALEIEAVLDLLESFYRSSDYAMAYSVVDALKYDFTRTGNSLNAIKDKLGITSNGKSGGNGGNGSSFFSKNNGNNNHSSNQTQAPTQTSLDEFAESMEADDDLPF